MSEISNITPVVVPTPRSHTSSMTGESNQVAVRTINSEVAQAAVSVTAANNEHQQLSAETVKVAAEVGNRVLQAANKNLQFQVDDATKQVVVKIVDSKTGEVVRQIPTVEMLDFIRAMKEQESNTGKLYSSKA